MMTDRIIETVIRRRQFIIIGMVLFTLLCCALSFLVPINTDMTRYLPSDSRMKQGMNLMAEEFSGLSVPATVRVMFPDLDPGRQKEIADELSGMEGVASAAVKTAAENENCVLYTLTLSIAYRTDEELALEKEIRTQYAGENVIVRNDDVNGMPIPAFIFIVAAVLLLIILFARSGSWLEPFLFLTVIGMAILINMGTNLILGMVSQTTYSISAVMQLVLSMDYSIILMNRYRQEKQSLRSADGTDPARIMISAYKNALPSILSSGFTTIVGLIMLVFMRFRIGKDVGLVLSKGVFWSMICVLTVLPGLILLFDRWIERTEKKAVSIPTGALSAFSHRARFALVLVFLIVFAGSWYLKGKSQTSFSLSPDDPIAEVFPPENLVILLYDNRDEEVLAKKCDALAEEDKIAGINAYSTTLGKKMTASEMTDFLKEQMAQMGFSPDGEAGALSFGDGMELNEQTMQMLYLTYSLSEGKKASDRLSLEELAAYGLKQLDENPAARTMLGDEMLETVRGMVLQILDGKNMLVGETHSLMQIRTTFPVEGEETETFLDELDQWCSGNLSGEYYLIGNSVMNREMKAGFGREFLTISLLTAVSIYLVVAVTFKNPVIPLLLVAIVQCAVFLTVTTTWLLGYRIYYLAVIIVQCILMGATVDYAILFTNHYREHRKKSDVKTALAGSYAGSVRTILTSSLFMILATGAIGVSPADPTITMICLSIAIGASCATILILFLLPGMLAALDPLVMWGSR